MTTSSFQTLMLSREQLYEQIWTMPTTKIAKSYGFSDVMVRIEQPESGRYSEVWPSISPAIVPCA
jgi:hypothetical protein